MWKRTQKRNRPKSPVKYPPGIFVKTEKGYFFIATPNKRYRVLTERVLDSWAPPRVVETTEAAVSKYRIAARLRFRNGSLIHNLADGKIYLIVDTKRCHIRNPDVLERLGATTKDVVHVSNNEIKLHEEGEPLD